MIKIKNGCVEIEGKGGDVVREIIIAINAVCKQMPREMVLPEILASVYAIPTGKKVNFKKQVEEMTRDLKRAISCMTVLASLDGLTEEESIEKMNEILGGEEDA